MKIQLDGATRVHYIVGDPIAQVKSPAGVTQAFQEAGLNAIVVPAHVPPDALAAWAQGVSAARNVDGKVILYADSIAAAVGAVAGTTTVTSYIESASGVSAGGRTGLTAVVVGLLFLVALFAAPLAQAIPAAATAPARPALPPLPARASAPLPSWARAASPAGRAPRLPGDNIVGPPGGVRSVS